MLCFSYYLVFFPIVHIQGLSIIFCNTLILTEKYCKFHEKYMTFAYTYNCESCNSALFSAGTIINISWQVKGYLKTLHYIDYLGK